MTGASRQGGPASPVLDPGRANAQEGTAESVVRRFAAALDVQQPPPPARRVYTNRLKPDTNHDFAGPELAPCIAGGTQGSPVVPSVRCAAARPPSAFTPMGITATVV